MNDVDAFIVAVSASSDVLDACRVMASSAGIDVVTGTSPSALPAGWRRSALLLVGTDATPAEPIDMPCVVVATADCADAAWRHAANIGAEHVAVLPEGDTWLAQRMIAAVEPDTVRAGVVGVIGGCGGAGASTVATGLALAGAAKGLRTLLIDADSFGGGLDLVVGSERAPGLRWPDLATSRGPLRPASLADSLPTVDGMALLSWDRSNSYDLATELFSDVVDAARRAFEFVIVDLPRHVDSVVIAACRRRFLVSPARVRAAVAASQVARRLDAATDRLVVRAPLRSGLTGPVLADSIGLPLQGVLRRDRGLGESLDRGDGVPRSRMSPLYGFCSAVVHGLRRDGVLPAEPARQVRSAHRALT